MLYNINNYSDKTAIFDSSRSPCSSDSDCNKNGGKCLLVNNSNKCYNFLDQEIYDLERENGSYIELNDVDSLNIKFSFNFKLNDLEDQIIVSSELNVWKIVFKGNKLIIKLYQPGYNIQLKEEIFNLTIIDTKFYNLKIEVSKNNIYCILKDIITNDSDIKKVSFYNDNSNIFSCPDINSENCDCRRTPSFTDNLMCNFSKNHKIIFGKPLILDNLDNLDNLNYLNGHLGDFKIDSETESCLFVVKEGYYSGSNEIKENCLNECINYDKTNCNINNCQEKCENIAVCPFKSSEVSSRHEIDCIKKCVTTNKCNIEFCKDQCYNCGSECFWNKNNALSQYNTSDKSGKPNPPKISLISTSYDGSKANIRWKKPFEGADKILGYILVMYKTFKKSDGLIVNKINTYNCNNYCDYIIKDLENNETYTLGLRSYNSLGIGGLSNLLTLKVTPKIINTNIFNEEDITNKIDFKACNA